MVVELWFFGDDGVKGRGAEAHERLVELGVDGGDERVGRGVGLAKDTQVGPVLEVDPGPVAEGPVGVSDGEAGRVGVDGDDVGDVGPDRGDRGGEEKKVVKDKHLARVDGKGRLCRSVRGDGDRRSEEELAARLGQQGDEGVVERVLDVEESKDRGRTRRLGLEVLDLDRERGGGGTGFGDLCVLGRVAGRLGLQALKGPGVVGKVEERGVEQRRELVARDVSGDV